jgi:predicted RNA binding protein YcfA (HicA-like mRNA interferase family)
VSVIWPRKFERGALREIRLDRRRVAARKTPAIVNSEQSVASSLPALKPAKVLWTLQRLGFYIHHIKGSHHYLKHPDKPEVRATIPVHGSDLKRRTLISII